MSACSFGQLLRFVDKDLNLNGQLEVYDHLDRCGICRDAVYELSRDRDQALLINRARRVERFALQQSINELGIIVGRSPLDPRHTTSRSTS